MSTCIRNLQTRGSQPIMLKNLPNHVLTLPHWTCLHFSAIYVKACSYEQTQANTIATKKLDYVLET